MLVVVMFLVHLGKRVSLQLDFGSARGSVDWREGVPAIEWVPKKHVTLNWKILVLFRFELVKYHSLNTDRSSW